MENFIAKDLQYRIGPFVRKDEYSRAELQEMIKNIEEAPRKYEQLVAQLTPEELNRTYRPGSWNIRQLVHHVADIQLLHFLRMKKALTEQDYKEVTLINTDAWAVSPDGNDAPIADSLTILNGITRRFVYLIRALSADDLQKSYYHPIRQYSINQYQAIAMASWHLQHHLAHIRIAQSNDLKM